jgi:hypothetical protein
MKLTLALAVFVITFSSCNSTSLKPLDLKGKWNFSKVMRNGKESKTMESAFFVFQDDKSVSSNLFQIGELTTFTIDNSKLIINDVTPLEFEISKFSKESMELTGKMNGFDMEFFLVKDK